MGKAFTSGDHARYHRVRAQIRARMRATDRSERITLPEVVDALRSAGFARSHRYVRAVLSGEKTSRPALREISAAVDALRKRKEAYLPDWL